MQNRGISSLFIRKLNSRYFFMKNTLKKRKLNFCKFCGFFANGASRGKWGCYTHGEDVRTSSRDYPIICLNKIFVVFISPCHHYVWDKISIMLSLLLTGKATISVSFDYKMSQTKNFLKLYGREGYPA